MLAVARRIRPAVAWQQGDAAALPFPDGSFDTEAKGSPLETLLDEEGYPGLLAEARDAPRPVCAGDGRLTMPLDAYLVTGHVPFVR